MHEVLSITQKEIKYRLSGPLYISRTFDEHLNFATNKTQPEKSPYELIKSMLNIAEDPIQAQIPPCTRTMQFISDQNKTLRDHIKYCLDLGASQENPPTYLYHKLIDNKPYLINREFILDTKKYQCNRGLILPNINGHDQLDNALILYNFTSYKMQNTLQYFQETALQHRWGYDTIKRKWTYQQFLPQKYRELLSIKNDEHKNLKSIYDIQSYGETNIRTYSKNFEYNVYARLHNLQLATNCIQFYVQGNILRDCSQFIQITCKDRNYNAIYGGLWQIFSVSHVIQGDKYTNILNCYRTSNNFRRQEKDR